MGAPLDTPAGHDQFLYLTESGQCAKVLSSIIFTQNEFIFAITGSVSVPHMFHPPELNNRGNYIISLSSLVRWLGEQAEELGVEIYPGIH